MIVMQELVETTISSQPLVNEKEIMVHDLSAPVFAHSMVIPDNCTSLGEDILESQG